MTGSSIEWQQAGMSLNFNHFPACEVDNWGGFNRPALSALCKSLTMNLHVKGKELRYPCNLSSSGP